MGEAHHRVLCPVEPARQRRHQGDGGDDAHDRPGAEAETAFARGVHGARGRMPDQQEPGEHQHAGVEGEEHVADGRGVVGPEPPEEGQHLARRAVGVGEEAALDRLRRGRVGRGNRGHGQTGECEQQREPGQAGAGDPGRSTGHDARIHRPATATRRPSGAPGLTLVSRAGPDRRRRRPACRLDQGPQHGRGPQRVRNGAAELGREQEAERAHGAQLALAAGLARPGRRRISSTPSANAAASMAPRRSSVR